MQREGDENIEMARHELRIAQALATELLVATANGLKALEGSVEHPFKDPIQMLPLPTAHRSAHRRGVQSRLDTDPELAAFVRARIDRLTFAQIVTAVAQTFPPEQRVSASSLHRWFHRQRRNSHPGELP